METQEIACEAGIIILNIIYKKICFNVYNYFCCQNSTSKSNVDWYISEASQRIHKELIGDLTQQYVLSRSMWP
jgi:hypothetical protein